MPTTPTTSDTVNPGKAPELFSAIRWMQLAKHVGLSPRQREIARLMSLSRTIREIAGVLTISEHTVRMHRRALYEKLDVHDRVGLVVRLVVAERTLGSE